MISSRRHSLRRPFDSNPPCLNSLDYPISPTPSRPAVFDSVPSPSDFGRRTTNNYSPPSPGYTTAGPQLLPPGDESMTASFDNLDFPSPAIRIQQSTPTPQLPFGYPPHQALAEDQLGASNWLPGHASAMAGAAVHSALNPPSRHRRGPSSSSAGSSSPASPYSHGHATQLHFGGGGGGGGGGGAQPLSFTPKKEQSHAAADEASRNFSNLLPTPTQTPTQESFYPPQTTFNNSPSTFDNVDNTLATHMAMRQMFADGNSVGGDEAPPAFSHSARQSVSSLGRNSPATPRTVNGEDFNEDFKVPSNDTYARPANVPKLERTMTDIFSETGYDPTSQPTAMAPQQHKPAAKGNQLLSPFHNSMISERIAQANQARSLSPSAHSNSRGVSPFREASRYAQVPTVSRPQSTRPQQNAQAGCDAIMARQRAHESEEPKTISPKDAVLDYHETDEDAKMPLFPDSGDFAAFLPGNSSNGAMDGNFGNFGVGDSESAVSGWPGQSSAAAAYSQSATSTSPAVQPQTPFSFAPASVPGVFHGLQNSSPSFPSNSLPAVSSEDSPEFPAHLTSMESSSSEAAPQSSSNPASHAGSSARPSSTLADTGTYTCTYHGCTQRFETPQKLQRHKREAHRPNATTPSPVMAGVGSGMTSAALAARNSQAGPHKCERINPTTGKPCNTVFSRPYDLTRHEDTIHNARKQKVRCALCQEEKTFSRSDALTRHMRVVHPDVDFPGKHRRRGGGGED